MISGSHQRFVVVVTVQSLNHVQLWNPMDCGPPGSSVPSLSPRVCSDSCPLSQWCCWTISSSATPVSFSLRSHQRYHHLKCFQRSRRYRRETQVSLKLCSASEWKKIWPQTLLTDPQVASEVAARVGLLCCTLWKSGIVCHSRWNSVLTPLSSPADGACKHKPCAVTSPEGLGFRLAPYWATSLFTARSHPCLLFWSPFL